MPGVIKAHALEEPFLIDDPKHPRAQITATFVDAFHCPGSVMVLLEGVPGTSGPILNTGNFRYCVGLLESPTLRRVAFARDGQRCQRLCLDMSFAQPTTMDFPLKEDSINCLLDLIDRHPRDRILLHSHCLGDEELLAAVADHFGEKLAFADERRYHELEVIGFSTLSLFGRCDLLPDGPCPDHYRFIVVSGSQQISQRRLQGIQISCSTLWWAKRSVDTGQRCSLNSCPVHDRRTNVWRILWSMHSSLAELRAFVAFIRPLETHGICGCILAGMPDASVSFGRASSTHGETGGSQNISDDVIPVEVSAAQTADFFSGRAGWEDDTLAQLLNAPVAPVAPVVAPPSPAPTEVDSDSDGPILPLKRQRSESSASDEVVEVVDLSTLPP